MRVDVAATIERTFLFSTVATALAGFRRKGQRARWTVAPDEPPLWPFGRTIGQISACHAERLAGQGLDAHAFQEIAPATPALRDGYHKPIDGGTNPENMVRLGNGAFLKVSLIQNSQNRRAAAMLAKLDELTPRLLGCAGSGYRDRASDRPADPGRPGCA